MEFAEFQRILNIGLGRAILYLQQHSASPYRDAILYAVPDMSPRSIGSWKADHADYLWEVIQLTGEPEFFKQRCWKRLQ